MKKLIFKGTAILALGFAALNIAPAEDKAGLEGPWIANVTVHDCQTGAFIRSIRELALFIHDGSFSQAGATVAGSATPRTSGTGAWRHTTGKTYNVTFQFLGLTQAGTFASMALGTRTLVLDDDRWTGQDILHFLDSTGNLLATVCSSVAAVRAPTP